MNGNQITGNIGLFYTCYRLSLLGWNAMPTIRNAQGADIIIASGEKKLGLQIKTLSNESDVPMGRNYNDPSVDFWIVIMNVRKSNEMKVYVIPQEDINNGVTVCEQGENSSANLVYHDTPKANGTVTYWLNKKFLLSAGHNYTEAWEYLEKCI